MNQIKALSIVLALCLLAACAPSQPSIQTAIAQTQTVWTPASTQTPYVITKIVTETFTPSPTLPSSAITVDGGWGHLARGNSTIAAFYMLIHNTGQGADQLIGASSEACSRVGLQQMVVGPGGNVPVSMGIPAGSVVAFELKDNSYRLICSDVTGGIGTLVPLTLTFEKFGVVKVTIEIGNPPP